MRTPVIEVADLVKVYKGGLRAVDGVSFTVGEGEFFGFLGPMSTGFDGALIGKALLAVAILFVVTQTATIWAFRRLTA